jgi:peroxin-13
VLSVGLHRCSSQPSWQRIPPSSQWYQSVSTSSHFSNMSAEQFGNLRDTLGSVFGIYAMMRYIRIALAKFRNKPLPPETDITTDQFSSFTDPNAPPAPPRSKKPLIIFLLTVFGLPYLMGKLIRTIAHQPPRTIIHPFDIASAQFYRAVFDFIPRNPAAEIPLRKGDVVAVVHRPDGGWWRARSRDGREGFVPAAYLEGVGVPGQSVPASPLGPIISPPGESGHAFIEEFQDE